MSNSLSVTKFATAAQVRAWALENGLQVADGRGRIPFEVATAYNKSNSLKYRPGAAVATKEVKIKGVGSRKVSVRQARLVLAANGVSVGARGRLSDAQIEQAWKLGNKAKDAQEAPVASESE